MNRIHTLLRLCRFPTVFTALADICAGYLLTNPTLEPRGTFAALLAASAGLYLSGMVFNDVFDFEQDARERPHRPIPAGAIRRRGAALFGSLLMGGGVLAAALAGSDSLCLALLLCLAILGYDRILKQTPLGPLAMGSCRFLNLLLGASAGATTWAGVWQLPQLWMAAALGVYITGVTWFARTEAAVSGRWSLTGAAVVINIGLAMLGLWWNDALPGWGVSMPAPAAPTMSVFVWIVILLTINRRLVRAIAQPEPSRVQPAVGVMLLSIIVIDATAILYQRGPGAMPYAVGTLALLAPAVVLRRWIALT